MTPIRHPSPVAGNRLTLADDLFVDDALIFLSPASRSVTYGAPGSPALTIRFPDMPHLGIWTKPGAGYVCIEPWQASPAQTILKVSSATAPELFPSLSEERRHS